MDLALVQGKDVAETAKQLALFYSSGYGEGLQHAGLAVNRLTVANEAHRMGLDKLVTLAAIIRAREGVISGRIAISRPPLSIKL